MHKKAELRERPLDAEKRLRESMRSHFGKERCYMIIRDGVEGVRERRARARALRQGASDARIHEAWHMIQITCCVWKEGEKRER